MRNWRFIPALLFTTVVILVVVYVAFYFIFLDLFVDLWWFRSLDFEGYFWLRLLYRFFLSGGVTLVFFAIFFFHFWVATRYLGVDPPDDVLIDLGKRQQYQRFADIFMSGSLKVYTPLSLVLAVMIAMPFYHQWEAAILYFFGRSSGVTEPVYGNDVSFYLFDYPIYMLIQKELLVTATLLFFMVAFLYWMEHIMVPAQRKEFPLGAKIHLTVLIGFVVLFVTWGFMLDRFSLLYDDSHQPVFFGPGFVEMRYYLPLIWIGIVTFLGSALFAVIYIFSRGARSRTPLTICVITFFVVVGLQKVRFIPDMMNKYIVQPNPVKTEKQFMENNIEATLAAYDLKKINLIDFSVKLDPTEDIKNWGSKQRFANIPLWDREYLIDVYKQLQGIRPYYTFLSVDEDRYFLQGHLRQVNLSAREMNISRLPEESRTWENIHLRYTHGYGAVVTPTAQAANEPIKWYLRDLNLFSDIGFMIAKPDIYYGQENYDYAIVPNKLNVVGLSGEDVALDSDYRGLGGVPIQSFFRKLLFTFYFKDEKIFFSLGVSRQSKIRFRRNIVERINTLAPYLHLDNDPYLVITNDRLFWIQDAYTLSDRYPVSQLTVDEFAGKDRRFNYIRNSVKIVVDAYNGKTSFYISDPTDAIAKAYSLAYPGVFKDLNEMPEELRKHLRFPRDIYYQQMKIYAKYHQTQPELFYQQAETWEFAMVGEKRVKPYYLTTDFGACKGKEEFVLINPMTPINRDNLSMIGVAGTLDQKTCKDDYSAGITIYKFRKEIQVNGPAQIDALIDQDPDISALFTLWDQHGSSVVRGRMIILPMGDSVLYVQPIYMISTKTKIPELVRVIVSVGNEVVMEKTLAAAFAKLHDRIVQSGRGGDRIPATT
ncbi:MAG: UPF0182 family protein, partial [Gammaproteobacteria bacterium]